ncbi:MAG: tRNA (adenosine(37)-N6)-threonylcarbamoyltransferase complex ATPase subunit type 1 TsaE [Candidatus Melainabacteria bacterium]|jgi:tRNA A37 threonylcarbamoyladenosine biosynthesis protein TsaE|nr:tRNA (adenosine(37)-N6)-threonylcarbamoyltransferase complex ATPase subunit type 1 TsaE [Candidatus Melainabacteria bacterium]
MMYELTNLEASKSFAVDLAKQLLESKEDTTLLFYAGMGCGKTTLIRELGQALGIQGKITSPTFVGMNEYHLRHPAKQGFASDVDTKKVGTVQSTSPANDVGDEIAESIGFYHYDLYQVGIAVEDFAEILESAKHKIICIEWAEQIDQSIMLLIEKNTKVLKIKIDLDDETRIVQVN